MPISHHGRSQYRSVNHSGNPESCLSYISVIGPVRNQTKVVLWFRSFDRTGKSSCFPQSEHTGCYTWNSPRCMIIKEKNTVLSFNTVCTIKLNFKLIYLIRYITLYIIIVKLLLKDPNEMWWEKSEIYPLRSRIVLLFDDNSQLLAFNISCNYPFSCLSLSYYLLNVIRDTRYTRSNPYTQLVCGFAQSWGFRAWLHIALHRG